MITRLFWIITACMMLVACTEIQENKKKPVVLNLAETLSDHVNPDFTWNDIVRDIEFIPLETSDSCLMGLGRINNIEAGNISFVNDGRIFIFDGKGKCISQFSRMGKGAEEYIYPSCYEVSDNKEVFVTDAELGTIFVYDDRGRFVEKIGFPDLLTSVALDTDHFVITNSIYNGRPVDRLAVVNRRGEVVSGFLPYVPSGQTPGFYTSGFPKKFNGQVYYHHPTPESDTVYRVTQNGLFPEVVFDQGQYRIPAQAAGGQQGAKYISWFTYQIAGDYLFDYFIFGEDIYYDVWRLDQGRLVARKNVGLATAEIPEGFPLTLADGEKIMLSPYLLTVGDNSLYFVVSALEASKWMDGVKEDDNMVVVKLTLK